VAINSEPPDPESVARAYFGAVARRDLEAMEACFAPGAVDELHGLAELRVPGSFRSWFAALFAAFPDFDFEVLDVMGSGEKAAVRWRARGSFNGTGRFEGLEPNGAEIDIEGCDVLTVVEGRIQRLDAYLNGAEMARQLGALPPQGSLAERALTDALNLKTRLIGYLQARRS